MSESATTAGERRVLAEAPSGELVDLSDLPDEERVVSPDVIRRLCVGAEAKGVDPRGIRVKGARIEEPLDLSFCTVPHPLRFEKTSFDAAPDLNGAQLPALRIEDCSLPGLMANGILVRELSLARSMVTGKVVLSAARLDGVLYCSGATLSNEGGDALAADAAEIRGGVFLREGFSASGGVRLLGATIGGPLDCSGATLSNEGGVALDGRDAAIAGALIVRNVSVTGGLDLFRASATTLEDDLGREDDPLGSWSGVKPLVLDGFDYGRFGQNTKEDSSLRRQWVEQTSLEQTSGFQQGAWQQLIEVYRAAGREDEATRAAVSMHNDRMKRAGLPWYRVGGRWILRVTVGHGYRPWFAGVWAAAIIAVFALVVWKWSGMFVPEKEGLTGSPQPVAYAADTFLPIVDLGVAGDWMPTGWVRWVDWSVILLGWALSTIFVAGFTRIVRS